MESVSPEGKPKKREGTKELRAISRPASAPSPAPISDRNFYCEEALFPLHSTALRCVYNYASHRNNEGRGENMLESGFAYCRNKWQVLYKSNNKILTLTMPTLYCYCYNTCLLKEFLTGCFTFLGRNVIMPHSQLNSSFYSRRYHVRGR